MLQEKTNPLLKKLPRIMQIKLFQYENLKTSGLENFVFILEAVFLIASFCCFVGIALISCDLIHFIMAVSHWECSSHPYPNKLSHHSSCKQYQLTFFFFFLKCEDFVFLLLLIFFTLERNSFHMNC